MTKNGDFGQNLYIRSTSNGWRITGSQVHSGFFALKHSVTIADETNCIWIVSTWGYPPIKCGIKNTFFDHSLNINRL